MNHDYFEAELDLDCVYFPDDIAGILIELEDWHTCFSDPDLIQDTSDQVSEELLTTARHKATTLTNYVRKSMKAVQAGRG